VDQAITTGFEWIYEGELSADLSRGVFGPTFSQLTAGSLNTEGVLNLYVRDDLRTPGPGSYQLVTACPGCSTPLRGSALDQPTFAGASEDFSHVIFETTQNLTADAAALDPSVVKLYEWINGSVLLAGILPDETPAPRSEAGAGALTQSSTAPVTRTYTASAISQDGSRIYFTQPVANAGAGRLYLRTDNGTAGASTVQVNVAEPTPNPSSLDDAQFWGATPDGSKVLFTTKENLTASDASDANFTDLYMYDADAPAGEHLTRISQPDAGCPSCAADVQGVVGISGDGRYVYFTSTQQLVSGQPSNPGVYRIFVWHDGTIREVAAIPPADVEFITGSASWRNPKTSRVSGDGTRLVFTSGSNGTGAPDDLSHSGAGDTCPSGANGCEEIYVYDAVTGGPPVCASCTHPDGPAQTNATFVPSVGRGFALLTSHLNRPVSTDGRFVFFSTGERLVPDDLDGTASDVYEYDTVTGQVQLLSSGKAGSLGSWFLDAGANGHDVFFITRDRLTRWDTDDQIDLYDARVEGGMPEPPTPTLACDGDTCHGPQGAPASLGTTASSTIASGNSARHHAKYCRKGRVRKRVHQRVRCVKRRHHHHHRARRAASGKQGRS
jgi:hypothetical protein